MQDIAAQASKPSRPKQGTRNVTVTFSDGSSHLYQGVPEDTSPEGVTARAEREFGKKVTALDGGRPPASSQPQPQPQPQARAASQPEAVSTIEDPTQSAIDAAGIQPAPPQEQFSDEWIAEQERLYKELLKNGGPKQAQGPSERGTDFFSTNPDTGFFFNPFENPERFAKDLKAGTGDVIQGIMDLPALVGNPLNAGINKLFGTDLSTDLSETVRSDMLGVEHGNGWVEAINRGGASGLGGAGLAQGGAKLATGGLRAGLAEMAATPIADTVSGASASVSAKAAQEAGLGPVGQFAAALAGGGAGYKVATSPKTAQAAMAPVNSVLDRVAPKLAQERFAQQQAGNPHLTADAWISRDTKALYDALSKKSYKGIGKEERETFLARINELEDLYLPREQVDALDLAPSVKQRLMDAMARRHILTDAEVQALRDGTPAGEAVADGIEKARRFRHFVPETGTFGNDAAKALAEAVGSAAGWKMAGPVGGALGGRIGRAAATPRGEKQAVKSATELAKMAEKFQKLPQVSAMRGAEDSQTLINRLASEAMDEGYVPKSEASRLEAEGRKVAIANARDDVRPTGGWRGLLYDRTGLLPSQQDAGALSALKDGAISPDQFDAFLGDPARLMQGNAGNAISDRLGSLADSGKLKRDPKWTPKASRVMEELLLTELDEIDPVQATLADNVPFRRSEMEEAFPGEWLSPAKRERADEIRKQLEGLRSGGDSSRVRNPEVYAATANANQQRVTDALSAVRSNSGLADAEREVLSTAIASIGNLSSRSKAQLAAMDAIDRLPEARRGYARSILLPLLEQIRK